MNAASKWASWASSPRLRPRFRWTVPRSGSSRPAASRRRVVFPAPFGPTSPIRSPTATATVTASRMTNVPISRVTPSIRSRLTARPSPRAPSPASRPGPPRDDRRPPASCDPPGPERRPLRLGWGQPETALARELRPAPAAPRPAVGAPARHRGQDPPRRPTVGGRQALAPRAEVGRPRPDDDPPDRTATARTGLAGALVDVELLLHRPVAVGRGVVVDRRAASLDRLGQDRADRRVQASFVGGAQAGRRAERVQPRRPERLVGVDVADPGEEPLVEEERLEPAPATAQPGPEGAQGEGRIERLGTVPGEDRRAAGLGRPARR